MLSRSMLLLCLLLVPAAAMAVRPGTTLEYKVGSAGTGSNVTTGGTSWAAPLSMAAPRTTDPMRVEGFRFLKIGWNLTAVGSATEIQMTCEESDDQSTWRNVPFVSNNVPPNTSTTPKVWKEAVSGPTGTPWIVGAVGYVYVRCTLTAVGGDGSTMLKVNARAGNI